MGFNSGFKGLRETAVLTAAQRTARTDGRTLSVPLSVIPHKLQDNLDALKVQDRFHCAQLQWTVIV